MANADGLRDRIRQRAEERFAGAVQDVIDATRAAAPRSGGTLEQSIAEAGRSFSPGFLSTSIVAPVEWASYQDQGTGIYGPSGQPIRPVNAKVLAWQGTAQQSGFGFPGAGRTASGMIFAAEVKGSPATHFWSNNVTGERWTEALERH